MQDLFAFLVALLLSFGFGLLYVGFLYWMDRYEKEPKLLVTGVFLWGMLVATTGALVFELIFDAGLNVVSINGVMNDLLSGSVSAPLSEELLKSAAVMLVFFIFRREFDSVLDGIIYASVVALGFAATENTLYLFSNYTESGWGGLFALFFLRVILGAWAHPLYTSFCGIGFALARMSRSGMVKVLAPLIGLGIGIFLHGLNNGILIVGNNLLALGTVTFIEWFGWFFIVAVMFWALGHERRLAQQYLHEEMTLGRLSPAQYATACSAWRQFWLSWGNLFSGRSRATRRFYQVCGELTHKKQQFATLGDEGGNSQVIASLQAELQQLAPVALA